MASFRHPHSTGYERSKLAAIAASVLLMVSAFSFVACEDEPLPVAPTSSPPPAEAEAGGAVAPINLEPKRLDLTEKDFIESIANRDPFRSYLAEFLTPATRTAKIQRKVILARYGLDELQLIAVVAGDARARAMFRDPAGLGVSVKRGDFISKSAGRVKAILPDKVIVEIQESAEGGQVVADRVIDLHPAEERARALSGEE